MNRIIELYGTDFKDAVDYIERAIDAKRSYQEITRGLEIRLSTRYESFRAYFGLIMPVSLNRYVKRRVLTRGYLQSLVDKPNLRKRSAYYGMKGFREKFEHEFNRSFEGVYNEETLQPILDVNEIYIKKK